MRTRGVAYAQRSGAGPAARAGPGVRRRRGDVRPAVTRAETRRAAPRAALRARHIRRTGAGVPTCARLAPPARKRESFPIPTHRGVCTGKEAVMKDQTLRVEYFAVTADDKPGTGADTGKKLAKENVNLLALLAFPSGPGKVQVDFVPENVETFTKAARKIGLSIGPPKTAFLAQGTDRPGALGEERR